MKLAAALTVLDWHWQYWNSIRIIGIAALALVIALTLIALTIVLTPLVIALAGLTLT